MYPFQLMPVDKTAIKTSLRINPALLKDPVTFIRDRELPIRTVKLSRGKRAHYSANTLILDVLTYKGIKVKLSKTAGASFTSAVIHFNPGGYVSTATMAGYSPSPSFSKPWPSSSHT